MPAAASPILRNCGEPFQEPTRWPERTSTALVAQLHRRFGDHERERPLSLAGVGAVLSDAHEEIIRPKCHSLLSRVV